MRPLHTLALGIALLLGVSARAQDKDKPAKDPAKDTYEAVVKESIKLMNDLGDVLASAKDEASADKAVEKIKTFGPRQKDLQARMEKLGKPDKETEEKLKKDYEPDMKKAIGRMSGEMLRISQDEKLKKVATAVAAALSGPKKPEPKKDDPKKDEKPKPDDKKESK
jgi:hypothetical protein